MSLSIWAYHGTSENGYYGIGCEQNGKGRVHSSFQVSDFGMLGSGLYASPTYSKARAFGEYVYLNKFDIQDFKVVTAPEGNDLESSGVDAVYMPSVRNGGCTERDEFCFCQDVSHVLESYLVRRPAKHDDPPHWVKDGVWQAKGVQHYMHYPKNFSNCMDDMSSRVRWTGHQTVTGFKMYGGNSYRCVIKHEYSNKTVYQAINN